MLPVTGDVCASDQVGFMGSRSPIKVKASFVVAILTDLAECKRFLTLFQRRTDSPGHDHDQVALAIGEYVAVATGNAPIAITVEATQTRGEASKASNMISRCAHSFICALPFVVIA